MSRQATRRGVLGLAALLVALSALIAPASAPSVLAATPDLTLISDTRYDVDPERGRIHVTVALSATNHLKDTKTRLYYFDSASLAVQPGTTGFKITSDTGVPTVTVTSKNAERTLLRINFNKRLLAGATRKFTLTFDIPDPGGAPTRDIRIGSSLVTFGAWSFASESTPGGSVTVVFPSGYSGRSPDRRSRRTEDRRNRANDLLERPPCGAAQVLRLLRRRSPERLHGDRPRGPGRRARRSTSPSVPGPTIRPGARASVPSSSAPCPRCPSGSACRG